MTSAVSVPTFPSSEHNQSPCPPPRIVLHTPEQITSPQTAHPDQVSIFFCQIHFHIIFK